MRQDHASKPDATVRGSSARRLALVGAGHAHLHVLAQRPPQGWRITLVSPAASHVYSGMISGWLAGQYPAQSLRFDLERLTAQAQATLVVGSVAKLEAEARRLTLEDGGTLTYDLAAVAVGSLATGSAEVPGVKEYAVLLKPIDHALEGLSRALQEDGPLLIAGGGAAGAELALCFRARTGRGVTLVERGDAVPRAASPSAQRRVQRLLAQRGVALRLGMGVEALEPGRARLSDGSWLPFATCLWATGAHAHPFLAASGASTDARGFLSVHDTLQSTSHPSLFASGDCASFASGQAVAKAGVFAVREAPVLWHNLRAVMLGTGALRPYRAQHDFLTLLNAGNGSAVLDWKGHSAEGRLLWRLKDAIDRRFMRRYR